MILVKEISKLVMEAIAATVFGLAHSRNKMKIRMNGVEKDEDLGSALRYIFLK